jgi:hypothetical protein
MPPKTKERVFVANLLPIIEGDHALNAQVWKETHVFLWKEDRLSWKEKPLHSLNSRPGLGKN